MAWKLRTPLPETMAGLREEWTRGLAAKDSTDAAEWQDAATRLRAIAATMRDMLLPMASQRAEMEALVDEMSSHLPERRTGPR